MPTQILRLILISKSLIELPIEWPWMDILDAMPNALMDSN